MYKSAADALWGLVSGKEKGAGMLPWRIKMPEAPSPMRNGIDYFFVEVTFGDGAQYGITAYGDEARELREQALNLEEAKESLLHPIIAR